MWFFPVAGVPPEPGQTIQNYILNSGHQTALLTWHSNHPMSQICYILFFPCLLLHGITSSIRDLEQLKKITRCAVAGSETICIVDISWCLRGILWGAWAIPWSFWPPCFICHRNFILSLFMNITKENCDTTNTISGSLWNPNSLEESEKKKKQMLRLATLSFLYLTLLV